MFDGLTDARRGGAPRPRKSAVPVLLDGGALPDPFPACARPRFEVSHAAQAGAADRGRWRLPRAGGLGPEPRTAVEPNDGE